MNIHFLQNQISRGEGYNIPNIRYQYIITIDDKAIRDLLQDIINSNIYLTKKDTFFIIEKNILSYYIIVWKDN